MYRNWPIPLYTETGNYNVEEDEAGIICVGPHQYRQPMHSTTWPGQSTIQSVRACSSRLRLRGVLGVYWGCMRGVS